MEKYLQFQLLDAFVGITKGDTTMEDLIEKIILQSFKDIKKMARKNQVCRRKSCGCVILEINLKESSIIHFTAVNGPSGSKNKCSNIKGACGCSHAEPRAIIKYLKKRKPRVKMAYIRTILLSTFSACVNCANIIVDSGAIDAVIYEYLATHWATPPNDAKSMLDRSLFHYSKKQFVENEKCWLRKWLLER